MWLERKRGVKVCSGADISVRWEILGQEQSEREDQDSKVDM